MAMECSVLPGLLTNFLILLVVVTFRRVETDSDSKEDNLDAGKELVILICRLLVTCVLNMICSSISISLCIMSYIEAVVLHTYLHSVRTIWKLMSSNYLYNFGVKCYIF